MDFIRSELTIIHFYNSHHFLIKFILHVASKICKSHVEMVTDRASFVDNEPDFYNGSRVTKPGRLLPISLLVPFCSTLFSSC